MAALYHDFHWLGTGHRALTVDKFGKFDRIIHA